MRLEKLSALLLCLMQLLLPLCVKARPKVQSPRRKVAVRSGMAYVPRVTFMMGTEASAVPRLLQRFGVRRAELFESESPRHSVKLSPFYIDRHEVTNAQFKKFLDRNPGWSPARIPSKYHNGEYLKHWATGTYPAGLADHPVVNVSWHAAVAFCRWEGKRLPTEAEWEYAARGGLRDREFPWGDEMPDSSRVNYRESGLGAAARVGSYAPNGYGLYDMAGNVWEFVADAWGPYALGAQADPVAGGEMLAGDGYLSVTGRRVIRGGSWGGAPVNLRVAYRDSHPAEGARDFVGFRCAASAPFKRRR
jgi:formylglycine-generating enzyme